jgi:hypothetical protein
LTSLNSAVINGANYELMYPSPVWSESPKILESPISFMSVMYSRERRTVTRECFVFYPFLSSSPLGCIFVVFEFYFSKWSKIKVIGFNFSAIFSDNSFSLKIYFIDISISVVEISMSNYFLDGKLSSYKNWAFLIKTLVGWTIICF